MKFGFSLPMRGPLATPATLSALTLEGELLGYDYCALSDHVVIPRHSGSWYPYTDSGEFPDRGGHERLEQLTTVAFLAARTARLRFVTGVMVAPMRPPVLTAKMLATIDRASGGRLTVGIGTGWSEEEFMALGAPPFAERGAVADESIRVYRALWNEESPSFDGRYVKFDAIYFEPRPLQQPLPIWVGGESAPALRRAAQLGDAWYPYGINAKHPLDSLDRLRAGIDKLGQLAVEAGREPGAVQVAYSVATFGEKLPALASDGTRRLFSGSPTELRGDLRALREAGVAHVDFHFSAPSEGEYLSGMRRAWEDVFSRIDR